MPGTQPMRLLTYSTLYPNPYRARHGIFVEERLRHLVASGQVTSRVVAPVAWLRAAPAGSPIPRSEVRHGIPVSHPRYPVLPKVGISVAPWLLAAATSREIARTIRDGYDFLALDAHYLYPDGVAAVLIGRRLGKPVVVTARGTDVNLIPRHAIPRRWILWAARRAAAIVTVSQALERSLLDLGVSPERVTTLRNGVDLDLFRPGDREASRSRLGLDGTTLLSAGHLDEHKGHHLVIEALVALPEARLAIAGDGPDRERLVALARSVGVADRVRFIGTLERSEMIDWYRAADALVLASSREGMPNVVLESLACGTPVVATAVGGVPEVVSGPAAGILAARRDAPALAAAVRELLGTPRDRGATRRHALGFGWQPTTEGQLRIFRGLQVAHRGEARALADAPQD
jgi:glycosyltransferase involved in cell wall biosynthesis